MSMAHLRYRRSCSFLRGDKVLEPVRSTNGCFHAGFGEQERDFGEVKGATACQRAGEVAGHNIWAYSVQNICELRFRAAKCLYIGPHLGGTRFSSES